MTERFTTRDGVTLAYRTIGNGPPLVCQPGGPGRRASYLRDLGGLDATRTLVLLDPRGTGESGRPADPSHLRATYLANDLEDLRAHLGYETFDLLGHSAGALVAQLYAAAHPERLTRLLLVTPSSMLQGVPYDDVPAVVESRRGTPLYDDALAAYATGDVPRMRPLFYGTWDDAIAAHANAAPAETDDEAAAAFYPKPGDVDTGALREALRRVTAPVLVLSGGRDGVTGAEAVTHAFGNAVHVSRAEWGHFPWVEDPAGFAGEVDAFLGTR